MVYVGGNVEVMRELRMLVDELVRFENTFDMLNVLDEYYKVRMSSNQRVPLSLLDYIKQYVI